MPAFCVVYRPGPQWRPGTPTSGQDLRPHALYMHRLMQEGKLVLAGPFPDRGGLAILDAMNIDEAHALVERDPAVADGIMHGEVHSWSPLFDRERGLDPFASAPRPR